jgi:hypothetical protein
VLAPSQILKSLDFRPTRVHTRRRVPCRSPAENDPQTHISLLEDHLAVLAYLIPPRGKRAFTLWHPDLHASSILVTAPPAEIPQIESILDWQTACTDTLDGDAQSPAGPSYKKLLVITYTLGHRVPGTWRQRFWRKSSQKSATIGKKSLVRGNLILSRFRTKGACNTPTDAIFCSGVGD